MSDNPFALSNLQPANEQPQRDSNPFSLNSIARDQEQDIRVELQRAVRTNPDQAARAAQLAKQYQVPADVLARNLQDVELQASVDKAGDALRNSPRLAQAMREKSWLAQQAHDDVGTLAQLEQFVTDTYGSAKAGVFNASKGAAGVFRAGFELAAPVLDFLEPVTEIGGNPLRRLAEGFAMQAQAAGNSAKAVAPKTTGNIDSGFQSGVQSLTQNLIALPMAFLPGGQGAALSMMTASTGGQAYQDAREKGISMQQALPFAASQAAIEYATEKLPLARLLGDVKTGTPILQMLAKQIALEVPGEQIATALQDMNEWAVLNPEKPFNDYLAERPNAAAQTLVATIVGTGGNVAVVQGIQSVVNAASARANQAQQAEGNAQRLADAMATATQSKLRERNPETFQQLVSAMSEGQDGAPQAVYIDANVLLQSATPEQIAQLLPSTSEQLQEAAAANASVEVPVSEALAFLPGTPLEQVFLQNARSAPDALSLAEVTQAGEQAQEFLKNEAERVMQQAQDQQAWTASSDAVKTTILDQLNQAGRFTPDVNEAYATLQMHFFSTMAARTGITPQEMYDRFSVKVAGQSQAAGGNLEQGSTQTDTPEFNNWFGDSKVVDADGKPLVVYHGTPTDFTEFKRTTGKNATLFGTEDVERNAFFFSDRRQFADEFAAKQGNSGRVLELYLSMQNPADLRDGFPDAVVTALEERGFNPNYFHTRDMDNIWEVFDGQDGAEIVAALKDAGYDGAILLEAVDPSKPMRRDNRAATYAVFDPTQIKSATGNNGQFDPNDPSILNQQARGTFNPQTLLISLNENANLSTFLHESGHFFLEVMADIASQPDVPAQVREDMAKVLTWFGIKGDENVGGQDAGGELAQMPAPEGFKTKVVGKDGKPLVVYHGTAADIAKFDPAKSGSKSKTGAPEGTFFFTDKADVASSYTVAWQGDFSAELHDNANVMPVYLEINKPLKVNAKGENWRDIEYKGQFYDINELAAMAMESGKYDGLIVTNVRDKGVGAVSSKTATTYIAFKPEQIVSALTGGILAQDGSLPTDDTQPVRRTPLETWSAMTLDQKRKHHERFAESFEAYLLEGRAPSAELQPLFRRFRSWLISTYQSLKAFMQSRDLRISDDIRRVFDRLVATDEQIAAAEEAAGMLPDFDATNEALERLQARSLRDLKWMVNARNKVIKALQKEAAEVRKTVEAEVRAEVEQQPVYKAIKWLRKGETTDADGNAVKAEKGFRLSTEALVEMYPDTMLARPELARLRGMTAKDGLHPDLIADMFGFANGDALVRSILDAEPLTSVVEGMTDQRMLERYGDLSHPEAIADAANEAVHNEARARALATELKAQQEMVGAREDTGRTATNGRAITVNSIAKAAKEFAANLAARRKVKDLKKAAWQHRSAEAKAGRRWQEATAKGQTQEAVQAKRDQVLNNAAAKALQDAQARVKKIEEFFKRVIKGNDEKVVERGRDPDVVNAMRAVLKAYGVESAATKRAEEYMDIVSRNDPAMFAALQPSVTGALVNAKPITEMTMEELEGLHDELRAMWHLAKTSRQMEVDGNMLDIDDAEAMLQERMQDIGVPDTIPGERGAITAREEIGIKLQFAKGILSRVEQWAERMDGKFGGPFLRLVFQPIKDAATRYRADRTKYRERFTELVKAVGPYLPRGPIAAPELGYTFGNSRDSGTAELLHAILHTGNDSNKRKLLLGRGWATENADGTMDTSRWDAFVARLVSEGKLRQEHFDFAQGVWGLLEETKPLAQAAHRRVFGRFFHEVTANEFTDPFGIVRRGGYVPAQTDARIVTEAKLRELAEAENESLAYAFPSAPNGFTKARVEYNKPLLLDLRTLAQHIDKVLLFSHMQPAVNDVRRLLTRKGVSYSLDRLDPGAYEAMLTPWLARSARQVVETPVVGDRKLSRFLSAARSRAGMTLMFANLSNTVQQITGFSMAAVKVKPSLMLKAAAQFAASPKEIKRQVAEASPFMADRMHNEVAAMNDAVEQILVNPSLLERGQEWTRHHAYFLQSAVDNTMSPIIWTAAYNQAIEQKMSASDAARFADGVIRQTQGSTLPEDVSRFETGPAMVRVFTQFVGYFNMMANTNATAMKQIVDEMGMRKGAGKLIYVALAGLLVPIWVAEAIAQAFRGGPDDEDDDGYLDDWLMAVFGMGTLRGLTAQVPIVGQAAQMVASRFNDNPADDKFSLSPAVSLIESSAGAPASIYKAIMDDGNAMKAVKDTAAAATLITGLPFYAAARPIGYLAGVADDRVEPTSAADMARGLVTGVASKDSRTR